MRMRLGSYTFARNPNECPTLTPKRDFAAVDTYNGVATFSWGVTLIGRTIRLSWNFCESAQYDTMEAIFKNDTTTTFYPNDGNGKTYNVEVVDFGGSLFLFLGKYWRKNVYMDLLLLSEGS